MGGTVRKSRQIEDARIASLKRLYPHTWSPTAEYYLRKGLRLLRRCPIPAYPTPSDGPGPLPHSSPLPLPPPARPSAF